MMWWFKETNALDLHSKLESLDLEMEWGMVDWGEKETGMKVSQDSSFDNKNIYMSK